MRDWKRKPATDKNWVNFQTHFTEAHLEMRESEATTPGAGYQGQTNLTLSYQQETVNALACLATATATDRKVVENLTRTVSTLTTELVTTNEKIVVALSKITKLTETISQLRSHQTNKN